MIAVAPNLEGITIPKKILTQIPEAVARQFSAVPFDQDERGLKVAMVDPDNLQALELIQAKTGKLITGYKIDQATLTKLLEQYSSILEIAESIRTKTSQELTKQAPAIKIVESILEQAVKERASDIHIEPTAQGSTVRFRVDGLLRAITTLPSSVHPAIVSRIKILSNLKIDVTRLPQDGRFQATLDSSSIDLRISIYPTVDGEKVVMRILDKSKGLLTLEQLGLVGRQFKIVEQAIHKPHGMTLVTGPTGSGKTTTLYAILQRLHKPELNIITIEDPVEYRITGLNQAQVHPEIGFTFAAGIRSIVRQDPDVVMIGEIRDLESAELAIQAALTGHIVLSTLHTNDAVGAIPRLLDLGIPPFLINASVNAIIAQRLARRLCQTCRQPAQLLPADQKAVEEIILNLPSQEKAELANKKLEFYEAQNCKECGPSGFSGRIGIFEVLDITDTIKPLIVKETDAMALAQKAHQEGMITLLQDGLLKAAQGLTTLQEIWRITRG